MPQSLQTTHDGRERRECVPINKAEKNYKRTLTACYLLAAFAGLPALGLLGCALCGFSVGIMWPGSVSISAKAMPTGGTALFALLALAGDLGGSLGPALVGAVSQAAGNKLQAGLLGGMIFPVALTCSILLLRRGRK